jgi:hypothetical protein
VSVDGGRRIGPGAPFASGPFASRRSSSLAVVVLTATLLSGCAELLPRTRSEEASPFATFEEARAAIEHVQPHRTSLQEMKSLGLDPRASTNVREVPYPQLVAQLAESPSLVLSELDPGIQECIAARQSCRAYQFHFSRIVRDRSGSFVLDFFNFARTTRTSGWRFEAVVLVRDDGVVLFRNHAGEPRIDVTEHVRNPLGPLQSVDVLRRW